MRRKLPTLLTLAGLLVAGCSEEVRSAPCSEPPDGSAVERVYRVSGGDARGAATRLCSRLRALGSGRYEVGAASSGRIRVVARDSEQARAALQAAIEGTSFAIYDWEPSVLGRRGPATPFAGGTALLDAAVLAARTKGRPARYYLFGPDRRPLGGPAGGHDELLAPYEAEGGPPAGSRVVGIPARVAIVEDQRAPGQPPHLKRYFVIKDDPELARSDINSPRVEADQVTGKPVVSFDFSAAGRRAFKGLTERVARRAAKAGASEASFQHFAIVVDGRILSLPALDGRANPGGIDAPGAQITGVGSRADAQLLARRLDTAPLDAELELVSVR